MPGSILEARHLHKSFGDNVAVQDVNFEIKEREIFGFLGPNGAGKTTTIRMLSTVLDPDGGDAFVAGHSVKTEAQSVRNMIGVCPQEIALYQELSALDNLLFFGRIRGLTKQEALMQAEETLELVGLSSQARRKVQTFSGGMKRRINLAVALMGHPLLVFLDEPTVGIDPQSRNHIFETIQALQQKGMTFLYTTHYMEEADRLCDRIAVIDAGRIIACGTAAQLKQDVCQSNTATLEDVFLTLTGKTLRD